MPRKTFFNLPEEKRKKITDTLIKYFATRPYSKVDIEDVSRECKVAKGSMYLYFENKKDMYFYVIEESAKKILEVAGRYDFEKISLFEYVEKSFEDTWKFIKEHPYEYMLLEKTAFYDDSPYKEEIQEFLKTKTKSFLYELIVKNQKVGLIREDISPELILIFIESSSWGLKRFFIEMAKLQGLNVYDLPKDYVKKTENDYLKLLKEGIEKK
uniref:TetR/AcrR family transcriptional regulator n=1 Tax=Dictyoglomus thermophilum TaxID=14 RepID=A0A7C3RRT4_DICTH